MSFQGSSLLELKSLEKSQVDCFFQKAKAFKLNKWWPQKSFIAGMTFLEVSTRTTSSFEVAVQRLGGKTVKVSGASSSVVKGESVLDTCLTLQAMGVDILIVRHGTNESLMQISKQIRIPMINAGEGISGHPTQGLLDAFTVLEGRGHLDGERLLIVGDAAHSRVAASAVEVFKMFGTEVAFCGPDGWMPKNERQFSNLEEGLKWCTVVMALRIQKERHQANEISQADYIRNFQLNNSTLAALRSDGLIIHPGPFNRGVEVSEDVLLDARSCIWKQVENGVFIRGAVISEILGIQ
jgi:aspartate carbamoyltransferase catalytic subunit